MDWPGGQQVNRHSRALLTILIVAAVGLPYWFFSRKPAAQVRPPVERPVMPPARGGAIVATNRTDPPSFNRLAHPVIATDLFALLTQGRLVRINRETQELEPWLAEKWQASADGRTFTLTLRD